MKILFVPYYYYLQYEPFKLTIKEMRKKGIDAEILYIPNMGPKDETQIYNPQKFKSDGINYKEIYLYRFAQKIIFFVSLLQIIQFYLNSKRLKNQIIKLKPDAIVIGSHLGGVYIRYLQILCYKLKIRVISIWLIEVGEFSDKSAAILKWIPLPSTIKDTLEWKSSNKYTEKNIFIVTGNVLRQHLIEFGLKKEQIVITGNPIHDNIHTFLEANNKNLISSKSEQEGKYIVLITEVIHEIFGIDYVEQLVISLEKVFNKLSADVKIKIKFHPRETEETKNIFRKGFKGDRYEFIENIDLLLLFYNSEISIGHFSGALELSLAVGTPVLSINFFKNRNYSLYKDIDKIMECYNVQEIEDKLVSFLNDESFRRKAESIKDKWIENNIGILDGKSSQRAAEAILNELRKVKK